jgi:O-antigen/teichoic acid export membrane protein
VLLRALAIVLVCALPVLAIFAVAGDQLLELAFGADRLLAADALVPLGAAFTLLALTYLAIQYLLALRRTAFLLPLGAIALAEPVLLLTAAPDTPDGFAAIVLATQAVAAVVALAMAFARGTAAGSRPLRRPRASFSRPTRESDRSAVARESPRARPGRRDPADDRPGA